jgi:hypothetical protein
VSLGDSYISGEGGRWAGNVKWNHVPTATHPIDALGSGAYKNPFNGEGTKEVIPFCHRSRSAEIFIQTTFDGAQKVDSRNFACSGSETESEGWKPDKNGKEVYFKPGLDFANAAKDKPLPKGSDCPLKRCKGQAAALQAFAEWLWNTKGEKIKVAVVSIGGNDFEFGAVVRACAEAYIEFTGECHGQQNGKFVGAGIKKAKIEFAIELVGLALQNAGYAKGDFTILVQDYPSPLPEKPSPSPRNSSEFRYHDWWGRARLGRCPFADSDVEWAYDTALTTIDTTVKEAATAVRVRKQNAYNVEFMELKGAFNGRRLCEKSVALVGNPKNGVKSWEAPTAVDKSEWINQVRITDALAPFELQEDFHPNFWGQLALRNCLRRAYGNANPANKNPAAEISCVIAPNGGLENTAALTIVVHYHGLLSPQTSSFYFREPEMRVSP